MSDVKDRSSSLASGSVAASAFVPSEPASQATTPQGPVPRPAPPRLLVYGRHATTLRAISNAVPPDAMALASTQDELDALLVENKDSVNAILIVEEESETQMAASCLSHLHLGHPRPGFPDAAHFPSVLVLSLHSQRHPRYVQSLYARFCAHVFFGTEQVAAVLTPYVTVQPLPAYGLPGTKPRPLLIGISGATRSGKGLLAEHLHVRLGTGPALCQDHYFDLERIVLITDSNWDSPAALDHAAFLEDVRVALVQATRAGKPAVVVEGFMAFWDPLLWRMFDLRLWIEISEATCRARRYATKRVTETYFDVCIWPNYCFYRKLVLESRRRAVRPLRVGRQVFVRAPLGTQGDSVGLDGGATAADAAATVTPDLFVLDGELKPEVIEEQAVMVIGQHGLRVGPTVRAARSDAVDMVTHE